MQFSSSGIGNYDQQQLKYLVVNVLKFYVIKCTEIIVQKIWKRS